MSKQQYGLTVILMCLVGLAAVYLLDAGRGQAEAPKATPAATFVGTETCAMCHAEVLDQVKQSPHGLAMTALEAKQKGHVCEGCHGPGSFHADDPSKETAQPLLRAAKTGEGCFQCHGKQLSRTDWRRSSHSRQAVSCLTCHGQSPAIEVHSEPTNAGPVTPHKVTEETAADAQQADAKQPEAFSHAAFTRTPDYGTCLSCHTEKRGEIALPSHHPIKEGRVDCADCHDPHRPLTEKARYDACATCHLGQRGPHLFEHGAISAGRLTDACVSCHLPHGSPNQRMLKLTGRGLCLQCHADRATHFVGRNCTECHSAVHGSNSSPLLFGE